MINENDYYKMIYDKYVGEQKKLGLWIEQDDFHNQMKKTIQLNPLTEKKPKNKFELSEEQKKSNQEYFTKVKTMERQEIKKPEFKQLTFDQAKQKVYNLVKCTLCSKEPIFNERDKIVYRALTQYFNKEQDFPKDLKKGICLFGGVGTGKTMAMNVFQQFCEGNTNRFKIFDMKQIAREVQKKGMDALDDYTRGTCCFEDVGFEKPVVHFGSKIDVFEELVNIFYERGKTFHITTNLAFNNDLGYGTFSDRYDRRVVDRLKEMVNVIGLDGDSKRK